MHLYCKVCGGRLQSGEAILQSNIDKGFIHSNPIICKWFKLQNLEPENLEIFGQDRQINQIKEKEN